MLLKLQEKETRHLARKKQNLLRKAMGQTELFYHS
jgi:hypothetical protein